MRSTRKDFPVLNLSSQGKPLVYLDNAASSQKPQLVIDRLEHYYAKENANIHRGIYQLSEEATKAYEEVRLKVRRFINAKEAEEVVFTKGTTEGINLVADALSRSLIKKGDEIVVSTMEHHSNIVPWQMVCEKTGAKLKVISINKKGELDLEHYASLLNDRTRLVSIVHISNALGTINPVKDMVQQAHKVGAKVLVDGAQAVPHMPVDVQELDCDFYVFSGHKVYGPTGTGILYGKRALMEALPPYQGGGDMIKTVSFEKTTYNDLPFKYEAGTPNIAGVLGLGAAIDYLDGLSWEEIAKTEKELLAYATENLSTIKGLKIIGSAQHKASVISFVMDCAHAADIGTILDQENICIRCGHHCTMPLMAFFDVPATARASFAFYNTIDEIDALVKALHKVNELFS